MAYSLLQEMARLQALYSLPSSAETAPTWTDTAPSGDGWGVSDYHWLLEQRETHGDVETVVMVVYGANGENIGSITLERITTSEGVYYQDSSGNIIANYGQGFQLVFGASLGELYYQDAIEAGAVSEIENNSYPGTLFVNSAGFIMYRDATGGISVLMSNTAVYTVSPDVSSVGSWRTIENWQGEIFWISPEGHISDTNPIHHEDDPGGDGGIPEAPLPLEEIFGDQDEDIIDMGDGGVIDADGGPVFIRDAPGEGDAPDGGTGQGIEKGRTVLRLADGSSIAVRTSIGTSGDDFIQGGGWSLGAEGNDTVIGNFGRDTLQGERATMS